ncbi:isoprenoid synthase domain-containing protein [Suillus discolor]|uniref:Terpene synthase n=1 Tax=Suillus discolor TaxID=1912936 RepID=A0A9P7FDM4_9AGAM|nr:isoprenoid synthase domain-containing protein [Suillus discolor]KAG2113473.1 isoprenoid synthase domain-containing protein [Suillus discolor]
MVPIATSTITSSGFEPAGFFLPDLFNDCCYPLRMNPRSHRVSRASEQWLFNEAHVSEPEIAKLRAIRASDLIAYSYPNADASHLRIPLDFLYWAFKLDDYLDGHGVDDARAMHLIAWAMRECCISALRDPINFQMDNPAGKICKSIFSRFIETASPGCTKQFIHTFDLFFIAASKEADNHAKGHNHNLESYTTLRWDLSGCKSFFVFIKYAARMDLPDEVVSHPMIMAMEDATNDFISWSNDICSYNKEQSDCDTYSNLIAVLMHERGLDLQGAADYSGKLCKSVIQRFEDSHATLPSWGEEVDKQVAIYIQGLQDLMVGSLHWYFDSARYFGKDGQTVKQDRFIKLLPQRPL